MKVAIHDGRFHADETFSVAVLQMIGPVEYVRTRDEEILKSCDLRVDVGRRNNPETGDFDHHQPEGAGQRENGVPYASFGLVWKYYGQQICGSKEAADLVDKWLIQLIDADDSGFDLFKPIVKGAFLFGVDRLIDSLMPSWKTNPTPSEVDEYFKSAVKLAEIILKSVITKAKDNIEADEYVRGVIKNTKDERLIVLDKHAPWQRVVIYEAPRVLFVVTPAWPASNGYWTVRAVDVSTSSFEHRKDLPEAWAGLEGQALVDVTGVKDAQFCHKSRFMAVATSKEGCLQLAELALKDNPSTP